MTRLLDARLAARRSAGKLAFMPFLVVGDPSPEGFVAAAETLVDAGADALELGFPYTDPSADGPVIQAADARALAAGTTTSRAFELIAQLRARREIPVSLLVYYNLVLQFGLDRFYGHAREAGIDAVLVADVPFELAEPLVRSARVHDVAPVCLASAVTTEARARTLRDLGESYIYAAARVGITGAQTNVAQPALGGLVERLRAAGNELPILAGFGLSRPEHIHAVRDAGADGAIVGSALVSAMAQHLPRLQDGLQALRSEAEALGNAAHQESSPC